MSARHLSAVALLFSLVCRCHRPHRRGRNASRRARCPPSRHPLTARPVGQNAREHSQRSLSTDWPARALRNRSVPATLRQRARMEKSLLSPRPSQACLKQLRHPAVVRLPATEPRRAWQPYPTSAKPALRSLVAVALRSFSEPREIPVVQDSQLPDAGPLPVMESHGCAHPQESPTQPFLQTPFRHAYLSALHWSLAPQMKAPADGEAGSEARQCLRRPFRSSREQSAHPWKNQLSSLNEQIPTAWHLSAQSSVAAALLSRVLNLTSNHFADLHSRQPRVERKRGGMHPEHEHSRPWVRM